MTIEIAKDFTIEISEETIKNDIDVRVFLYLEEVRKAMDVMRKSAYNSEEYNEAYRKGDLFSRGWDGSNDIMSGLMDYVFYNPEYSHLYDTCYSVWNEYHDIDRAKYAEYAMDDFMAFERKNVDYANGLWIGSEEGYNTYSDWSKDIFGYRKRWRVASRLTE